MTTEKTNVIAVDENEFQEPVKKEFVYKKLYLFNEKKVREVMNTIIARNRQVSLKQAGNERVVRGSELKLILKEFA